MRDQVGSTFGDRPLTQAYVVAYLVNVGSLGVGAAMFSLDLGNNLVIAAPALCFAISLMCFEVAAYRLFSQSRDWSGAPTPWNKLARGYPSVVAEAVDSLGVSGRVVVYSALALLAGTALLAGVFWLGDPSGS